MIQIQLTCHFS